MLEGGREEGGGGGRFHDLPLIEGWEAVGEPAPRETRTATLREQVAAGTLYLANGRLFVPPGWRTG